MQAPLEIELKLAFPREFLERVRQHPWIQAGVPFGEPQLLRTTYFDTPEEELRARRVALRVREAGGHRIQTVKGDAPSVAGLSMRPEWSCPAPEQGFSFSGLDAPLRQWLEAREPQLMPVFTMAFVRETRCLNLRDGVEVALMIDHGELVALDQRAPLHELELELVRGDAADLTALAARLREDLPLTPEDASKAQRGYDLRRAAVQRMR